MQNQFCILVVYEDPTDPIVTLLANHTRQLQHQITFISLQEFIEKIQINDQIDTTGVTIQWKIKTNDNATKVWTNHNTYLVNRCYNFKENWTSLFHPDDREYAWNELTAYLNFAFTAFKRLQPVGYYGLSGSVMPLFIQWDQLKGQLTDLQVPHYYIGPHYLLKWSKAIINPDPYDVTYWVAKDVHDNTKRDYVFAYERPRGQPIVVYITPIGADIGSINASNQQEINEEVLKDLGIKIGQKLGIRLGEILLFVAGQHITFGAATPRIIHTQNTPNFQALTLQALTTVASYTSVQGTGYLKPTNPVGSGSFITIGSKKDRTISTLVDSQPFSNNGVLLSLEECTLHWHFSYADGKLSLFTKEVTYEAISAIYYRPFDQKENKNDALDLLHA